MFELKKQPYAGCYDICFDGWSDYINNKLRSLVTTGKGQPNPKEDVTA